WREYSASDKRPGNVPSYPSYVYKNDGWISMPDWLGTAPGRPAKFSKQKQPDISFSKAREFVRLQELDSRDEFFNWVRKENPPGIPWAPDKYEPWAAEWTSYSDFCG